MNRDLHIKFLELAGFEATEIEDIFDEWLVATKKLELNDNDIKYATEVSIPKYWNTDFLGIRKCIGALVREIIDISKLDMYKQNGVKIVYGILPSIPINFYALKYCANDRVYTSFPDYHIITFFSMFFNKENKFIQHAEKIGFNESCRHCGLNKSRVGSRYTGIIPYPDVNWCWGYSCDEAPKIDEFINCYFDSDWKYVVTRLPHDTCFGERDDEIKDRVEYFANSIKDGQEEIGNLIGYNVTQENLMEAVEDSSRYVAKIDALNTLLNGDYPQWISGNEMSLFEQPLHIIYNTGLKYMEEALDTILMEIEERNLSVDKNSIEEQLKIGCYFVPYQVPWVDNLFKDNGVNLSFSTSMSYTLKQLEKSKYVDPYKIIAEKLLKMPPAINAMYEAEITADKIERYNPDAMLFGFFDFDRWMGGHQKFMVNMVEEKTRVPHFYIEGDFWDDRSYKREDMKSRVETISNYLKMSKIIGE